MATNSQVLPISAFSCRDKLRSLLSALFLSLVVLPAQAGFLYVMNGDLPSPSGSGNRIYGFSVNEASGGLTLLPNFPVATNGNSRNPLTLDGGEGLAINYEDKGALAQLFAINTEYPGSNSLSAFQVDRITGAVSLSPFSPIRLPAPIDTGFGIRYAWACVKVHPSGSPLIVAEPAGQIASYNLTATSATAAVGSPFIYRNSQTKHANPISCAFSQNGNNLYLGGNWPAPPSSGIVPYDRLPNSLIEQYSVNASTGVLTERTNSPFDLGFSPSPSSIKRNPLGYATDSAGRLFVASASTPEVFALDISSGDIGGGTYNPSGLPANDTTPNASFAILHPAGYYLVAGGGTNQIGVFKISGSGSATTLRAVQGSPFSSGLHAPGVLVLNGSGTVLYAVSKQSITLFSFNASTGALSALPTQPANILGSTGIILGAVYLPDPTIADLSITKTATPGSTVGANLTYTLTTTNSGPASATTVTISDTLPTGVTFVSATPSQGICNGTATVSCNMGVLANGASASVTIVVKPSAAGNLANTATVSASETDPNTANNQATATVTVGAGCANTLSTTSLSVGAGALSGGLNVIAAAGCSWGAASQVNWIHVTSGSSGSGNGSVGFAVDANSAPASRTGTISIAGHPLATPVNRGE